MPCNALERISDRTIPEKDLRSEIAKLEDVTEPASFWVDIANDRAYSADHRALAVCQLFDRHLREPISLASLARLLDGPDWIAPRTVSVVAHLRGELPVEWNLGETVLAILLFPGKVEGPPTLYLRLSRPLEPKEFVRIITAPEHDAAAAEVSVLETACG